MEAKEKSLTFLREQFVYIVPYFQRGYVWNEDNWDGIWQELTAKRNDCFLGSIILKREKYLGREEECNRKYRASFARYIQSLSDSFVRRCEHSHSNTWYLESGPIKNSNKEES